MMDSVLALGQSGLELSWLDHLFTTLEIVIVEITSLLLDISLPAIGAAEVRKPGYFFKSI
jgi:hypothetical protein